MDKHSPLPWVNGEDHPMLGDWWIKDANGRKIFCQTDYYPWVTSEDFPFIVRAVNNFENLKRCLENLVGAVTIKNPKIQKNIDDAYEALRRATEGDGK